MRTAGHEPEPSTFAVVVGALQSQVDPGRASRQQELVKAIRISMPIKYYGAVCRRAFLLHIFFYSLTSALLPPYFRMKKDNMVLFKMFTIV
eukprot:scaffold254320_cov24-Prasinocladus_malaysianus.AAC.1